MLGSAVAVVPSHALGHAGAGRDTGPRDDRRARRQPALAVHQRAVSRLRSGGAGRRAADPEGSGEPADGYQHHRRGLRGGGDRRDGQRHRRLSRGAAGGRDLRFRRPAVPEAHAGADIPGDGGGAGDPSLRSAWQAGGREPQHGTDFRHLPAACRATRTARGARGADSARAGAGICRRVCAAAC